MPTTEEPDDSPVDEDVQDDAIIAAAFRTSLLVLMLMGLPVIGWLIYLNINQQQEQATEAEVLLPTEREADRTVVPRITLVNVTEESGVDFVHQSGKTGEKLLPETMGSGVAVIDYNKDGHEDLFFVNSKKWEWDDQGSESATAVCRLYRGDGKFHFEDVSKQTGLDQSIYGMGVAAGDYDNDGDTDLFLSAVGSNRLLRNDEGKFIDVTLAAGVGGEDSAWSTSCGFFDYDNDGLLDLFVANYVSWDPELDRTQNFTLDGETRAYGPPRAFAGSFSYLYHNEGNGKFLDVSEHAGIQVRNDDTNVPLGKAMGIAPVDFNDDGWMDLVVANDTVRNFLFENNKDGTFREVGRLSGIAFDRATGNARGAMGIDTARFHNDGTLAVGIGNFANEASALYMARPGRQQFIDAAMYTGFGPPTRQGLTFGLFFFDVDLDGRIDILGANGHLEDEISITQATQSYHQAPQLFWNAGKTAKSELMLTDVDCVGESFCTPIVGRGAAYGDFDEDGDLDVVISTSHSAPAVFRNDQATGHHFLRVRLEGDSCNRDAIGATVELQVGGKTLSRVVMPTRGYLSQSEKIVTFGLGTETSIESLTVKWPDGSTQAVEVEQLDQTLPIKQR